MQESKRSCKKYPEPRAKKSQRGMVLILVLMVFALAAVIAGELSYDSHREVRRTANILHSNESYLFARGGEVFAIQKLLADYSYDKQSGLQADYLAELWATESEPYSMDSINNDTSLDSGEFVEADYLNKDSELNPLQDIGELVIVIEDLQARFNVNNVQYDKQGHISGSNQFANVMNAVLTAGKQSPQFERDGEVFDEGENVDGELESAIYLSIPTFDLALALVDWVDLDNNSALASGGEDDFYAQKTPAYRAANQSIFDITELMSVKGFDQGEYELYNLLIPKRLELQQSTIDEQSESEIGYEQDLENEFDSDDSGFNYDAEGNVIPEPPSADRQWGGIQHYFIALPFPSKINVNTAPAAVLQSIFTLDQAQKIITGREGSPYQNVNDIFLNLSEIKAEDKEKYTHYLSVNSQYFMATSIATIGETKFTLQSKLFRDDKGEVRVLSRDFSH